MYSDPPTPPYRDRFHDTLEQLEGSLQAQGPWCGPLWLGPPAGW
jgi:hypothetical protein